MGSILINNCAILTMADAAEEKISRGCIGIEGNVITLISSESKEADLFRQKNKHCLTEIDGTGKLAMPGLVNTHNHISMTLMRSYADDLPLMAWLNDHIWPFEARMTYDNVKSGARLGIAEMLLGGITTTADMYWHEEAVGEAVEELGIRAVLSPTFTDLKWNDFYKDFTEVLKKYGSGQHSRITLMIAPHSAYTCSAENLLKAKELSEKHNIPLNIHVSETLDEQRIIAERYGKTPIEFLDELGLLCPSTLTVHDVHVNEADIDIMAKRGVSVAYNPQSNMKLASGVAPVAEMLAKGLNISIGTDGPSSNNDLDMWDEMRSGAYLQKLSTGDPCVLPAYEVLRMATINGAKALGLGHIAGSLEKGKAADVILIDTEQPHFYPQNDMIAHLVYCGKSSDVHTVIIDGEIVVEARKLKTGSIADICRDAEDNMMSISQR